MTIISMTSNTSNVGDTPISVTHRHAKYCWDDNVTFVVEGILFTLPRERFVLGSPFFSERYGLQTAGTYSDMHLTTPKIVDVSSIPGGEDRKPIDLEGVTTSEFEALLKLMFPELDASLALTFSKEEWLSILRLSTLWHFKVYRKTAINEVAVQIQDPVELVKHAREFGVFEWLVSGYSDLVVRKEPMDEEAGLKLGLLVALKLSIIREERFEELTKIQTQKSQGSWGSVRTTVDVETKWPDHIRIKFREELEKISERQKQFLTTEEKEAYDKAEADRMKMEEEQRVLKDKEAERENVQAKIASARDRIAREDEELREREGQLQRDRIDVERMEEEMGCATTKTASKKRR